MSGKIITPLEKIKTILDRQNKYIDAFRQVVKADIQKAIFKATGKEYNLECMLIIDRKNAVCSNCDYFLICSEYELIDELIKKL